MLRPFEPAAEGPRRSRARLRWSFAVCLLGLSACVRFGYGMAAKPAADGGRPSSMDAATSPGSADQPDAARPMDTDAAAPLDAGTSATDAATSHDAAVEMPDASTIPDASYATPDASSMPDAATSSDAGPTCTPKTLDYCTQLPPLGAAPVLDGVLDCGPALIDLPASGWNSTAAMPSDNHARYAAAWRPDGLYLYVEVDDPLRLPALASDVDPWCGDGVELYADADGTYVSAPDYDYPGAMQLLAAAPAQTAGTALAVDALYHTRSSARIADWSASRHVMVPRTAGYALEAFIAAADIELSSWQLTAGASVGFDIAINVSVADASQKVGCGHYLGQYYLRLSRLPCNADNCRPYSNAAAFCTAVLQ